MPHPALDAFWQSRIVFYPGYGSDGHPVKFFNSLQLATCFVYADYWVEEEEVKADLDNPAKGYSGHFKGYHSVARIPLTEADLGPRARRSHGDTLFRQVGARVDPYVFLEVMERDAGFDDSHGAQRLSVLFLGTDGHATYEALFCQVKGQRPPYAVALQDHGFGGNYSNFGRGGVMERMAIESGVFPEYLLVAEGTLPWNGYVRVPEVAGSRGGMMARLRHLYRREADCP